MRVNRFVLDANIWVSYLITETEQQLVNIISDNDFVVFRCDDVSYALRLVKKVTAPYILTYPIKRYIPTDKDDDYLIALALQTSSGFITSGDKNILSEKERLEKKFKKLKILAKAEFEAMFLK